MVDAKIMPNAKINEAQSDWIPKEIIHQCEKADKHLKKTKKARSSNKESSTKIKRLRKFGYSRWGRKEDCQMFSALRQLWKEESVDIEDFYADHAKISTQHDCILLNLVSQMNWRGDVQSLLKRIQTQGRDQSLVARTGQGYHTYERMRKERNTLTKECRTIIAHNCKC